jgi:hypothetical protein
LSVDDQATSGGKAALGADLVIPVLALGFSIYFFISIVDLSWEAKANGMIIGTLLLILVAIQLGRIALGLVRRTGTLGFAPLLEPRPILRQRIAMVLVTVAFIATLRWLGLTLALFLGMLAGLRVMGVRKPLHLVSIALAVAAAAYMLFIFTLDSGFPHGPVENLIDALKARP